MNVKYFLKGECTEYYRLYFCSDSIDPENIEGTHVPCLLGVNALV